MTKTEIPEMTGAEETVWAIIAALFTLLVIWPIGFIAYVMNSSPWHSPRIGTFLRYAREQAYNWMLVVGILGFIALVLITLSSVANFHYGDNHYPLGSVWWGGKVAKFFGL